MIDALVLGSAEALFIMLRRSLKTTSRQLILVEI